MSFKRVKSDFEKSIQQLDGSQFRHQIHFLARQGGAKLDFEKLQRSEKKQFGEWVLQLYFFQIFHRNEIILDLGPTSFFENGGWAPRPIYFSFDPYFLEGIRKVYQGLFFKNDLKFDEGLQILKVAPLRNTLKTHFKNADTQPIQFTKSDLKLSTREIFQAFLSSRCLPPKHSLPFGIYLGFLYQTLSKLDVALDVSRAFQQICQEK